MHARVSVRYVRSDDSKEHVVIVTSKKPLTATLFSLAMGRFITQLLERAKAEQTEDSTPVTPRTRN